MDIEKNIKEDILRRAENLLHYNNLLIEQCDKWLSEEEGARNTEKQIAEKRKKSAPALGVASRYAEDKASVIACTRQEPCF